MNDCKSDSLNRSQHCVACQQCIFGDVSRKPKISLKNASSMKVKLLFCFHWCKGVVKHGLTPSFTGEGKKMMSIIYKPTSNLCERGGERCSLIQDWQKTDRPSQPWSGSQVNRLICRLNKVL